MAGIRYGKWQKFWPDCHIDDTSSNCTIMGVYYSEIVVICGPRCRVRGVVVQMRTISPIRVKSFTTNAIHPCWVRLLTLKTFREECELGDSIPEGDTILVVKFRFEPNMLFCLIRMLFSKINKFNHFIFHQILKIFRIPIINKSEIHFASL